MLTRVQKVFSIVILSFVIVSFAFAADSKINAGLLKNIWYSKTEVFEGDKVSIFTGIFNQSGVSFSGVASFYANDEEISKKEFISKPESLIEISGVFVASSTRTSIKVKLSDLKIVGSVSTSSSNTDILLSSETDSYTLSVSKKITLEQVKTTAVEVASNIVSTIDEKADSLSDTILSLKKETVTEEGLSDTSSTKNEVPTKDNPQLATVPSSASLISKAIGQVLGAETKYDSSDSTIWSQIKNSKAGIFVHNIFLDALSFIVKYWKITSFVIFALFLIFKFLI